MMMTNLSIAKKHKKTLDEACQMHTFSPRVLLVSQIDLVAVIP